MIANILNNGEGYSNLKQIVKESVKAVLANNKELISASFAALIQTSKNHPQRAKLIYNISRANDGENKIIMITITLSNTLNPIRITYNI